VPYDVNCVESAVKLQPTSRILKCGLLQTTKMTRLFGIRLLWFI